MKKLDGQLLLSASDLVGHLNCDHLTRLDIEVVHGKRAKPYYHDPLLDILVQRGELHEKAYVEHLRALGLQVVVIDSGGSDGDATAKTIAAMKQGAQIIVQGVLGSAPWHGRPDILRRIERPSALGPWSYEVFDTKLARETKGGTVLQLCLYSELVGDVQGLIPEHAYVLPPNSGFEPERYRIDDYAAYFRFSQQRLLDAIAGDQPSYPEPTAHCEICRWRQECDDRRRGDDHLSLVAGISATQRAELKRRGVETTAGLAELELPLPWRPDRGAASSYERVREQARVQVEGRTLGKVIHELLPLVPTFGLARLPAPSDGDIFLDLEGDPFAGEGGTEYLFGYATRTGEEAYFSAWALSREDEKNAFEAFIDFVFERKKVYPTLHIYHYAPYEPAALKRLMGRYASREEQVDALLRGGAMVDLFSVVKHAIRASVESYSIKKLEPLYGFKRAVALPAANVALNRVQSCLELGALDGIEDADRAVVEGYNRDDCLSTWRLRDWLEQLRSSVVEQGIQIERPTAVVEEPTEEISAWQERIAALVTRLTEGIPADPAARSVEQQATYTLAYVLDWHRRERKASWWEYFRLSALSAEELFEERAAISGLAFVDTVGGTPKAPVQRYSFPAQGTELRAGDDLHSVGGAKFGKVVDTDPQNLTIDVKKRGDTANFHPEAIFAHGDVDTKVLAEALVRIGEYVAAHGISGPGSFKVARDILLRARPDLGGVELRKSGETIVEATRRVVTALQGVLPIQGPPGAGKTYAGAQMILELARAGKKIGVTANSHKVIRNLLDAAVAEARGAGFDLQCMHKASEKTDAVPHISFSTDNGEVLAALAASTQVVSGTAWFWARIIPAGGRLPSLPSSLLMARPEWGGRSDIKRKRDPAVWRAW